jgi:ABC-type transporter MlaC component
MRMGTKLAVLRLSSVALAMLVMLITPAEASAGCAASGFITAAGGAFDRAARGGSAEAFSSAAERYTDVRAIGRFALGNFRPQLPSARQEEYFRLVRHFMGVFMAAHSQRMQVGSLQIVDCSGGGAISVTARTSSGQKIMFRLYQAGGSYRISDVNVQSVWLAQQLRSVFVGTIRNNNDDIGALFTYLKRK